MDNSELIRLWFDQYTNLDEFSDDAIVVSDVKSYATARRAVEDLKSGERRGPLAIVVRSRQFFAGFHDLDLLGNLTSLAHIAPRDELESTFHIEVPIELKDRHLIQLGIRGAADLQEAAGESTICDLGSFEDALLAKSFGAPVFSDTQHGFESWIKDFADFSYSEETPSRRGWGVRYIETLALERVRQTLEQSARGDLTPFVTDLLGKSAEGEARSYLDQLAVRYWLRSYSRLARKTVVNNLTDRIGHWQDVPREDAVLDILAAWFEALYEEPDNRLLERVEQVLAMLLSEGDLLEDEDLDKCIQKVSGRFMAEYEVVQASLGQLLLERSDSGSPSDERAKLSAYLSQSDGHFEPLFRRTGQPAERSDWLILLLELTDVVSHLEEASPSLWPDWLAVYELLILAKNLRGEVRDSLPDSHAGQFADLEAVFWTLEENLNGQFADWLLQQYPGLVSSSVTQPPLVMDVARMTLDIVAQGARVILLVVDGLDWELWQYLRSSLGERNFFVQGDDAGLAMVPTITEFSRRALFGGLSPRNLAGFIDDIYGTKISPREEARSLARALGYLGRIDQMKALPANGRIQYLEGELVYANGGESDFLQALALDAKCYALVYTEIDAHLHDSKLGPLEMKKTMRFWLEHLIQAIFKGIEHNPVLRNETNPRLIVTSDHGFLDVSERAQVSFDGALGPLLDLERHGRLAIARVSEEECPEDVTTAVESLKEFCDENSAAWHVIWHEQGERYGLAESSPSEGKVIAWLMPRLLQYVRKGRGNYVHGGLSMYETIVPIALLTKGELEAEAPVLTLTGQLLSEEECTLSLVILNKNDRRLHNLVISIPELGLRKAKAGDVGPREARKLALTVVPPKSGDISVMVAIEMQVGGSKKRFDTRRTLTVKPGRSERMRLSTRRSFDDEW